MLLGVQNLNVLILVFLLYERRHSQFYTQILTDVSIRVVKAPFFKAVSKRLIKAVKRLLYVVNLMNDCFKMHYTSVHPVDCGIKYSSRKNH